MTSTRWRRRSPARRSWCRGTRRSTAARSSTCASRAATWWGSRSSAETRGGSGRANFPNPPTEDQLDHALLGGSRESDAVAGVELPVRPHIEVQHAEELMLLLGAGDEVVDRAHPAVVLDADVHLRREVAVHDGIRRELESLA